MIDRNDNEKRLIMEAMSGKSFAFGLLYDKYQPKIYRFILFKVSHREEAEDITHQVFLNAWKKMDEFKDMGFPFSSWLFRIARNKVIDYYRTKKNILSIDEVQEIEIESDIEKIAKQLDLERIFKALDQLTEEQRDVIILKFVDGLKNSEIAKIMDKSYGAIRVLQYRSIKKIRHILERDEK